MTGGHRTKQRHRRLRWHQRIGREVSLACAPSPGRQTHSAGALLEVLMPIISMELFVTLVM